MRLAPEHIPALSADHYPSSATVTLRNLRYLVGKADIMLEWPMRREHGIGHGLNSVLAILRYPHLSPLPVEITLGFVLAQQRFFCLGFQTRINRLSRTASE
jgi:hypothetical protein